MFRLTIAVLVTTVAVTPAAAQHGQHGQHPQGRHQGMGASGPAATAWRELNGFHSLLHLSHYAMMKSGDLAPARRTAPSLLDAAKAWAASTSPAECSVPEGFRAKLEEFTTQTESYAKLVAANGTDDEVKASLGQLHGKFRELHRVCMPMMEHNRPH
ncbi:MAG: hypothetical protein ACKVZ0_22690 [Gemmatimonadales bacterium]